MKILSDKYFWQYKNQLQIDLGNALNHARDIELTAKSFTFYTSVAVISSYQIEGEKMETDSYLKHKMQDIEYVPELVEKPNDLFQAYLLAREHKLTRDFFLQSHILLSKNLLPEKWRGVYRKNEMLVMEHETGKIQFEAAPFTIVQSEMEKLWSDISQLLSRKLTTEEIFYYASYKHLTLVNIHPFNDGNGRAARLLEKWFLSQMLGETAWYIQSEKYSYLHVTDYYKNLNRLGMFYEKLDNSKATLFLQMLPNAIGYKGYGKKSNITSSIKEHYYFAAPDSTLTPHRRSLAQPTRRNTKQTSFNAANPAANTQVQRRDIALEYIST